MLFYTFQFYQSANQISNTTMNKFREYLTMSILRENGQISLLKAENRELKNTLDDYKFTLELIMHKYRKQINQLIQFNKITREQCLQNGMACGGHPQQAQENMTAITCQYEKIQEMVEVIKNALKNDDDYYVQTAQKIKQITEENKMLRELLQISKNISGVTFGPVVAKTTSEVGVQTDDSAFTLNAIACSNSSSSKATTSNEPSNVSREIDEINQRLTSVQIPTLTSNMVNKSDLSSVQEFADQIGTIKKNVISNGKVEQNENSFENNHDHVTI